MVSDKWHAALLPSARGWGHGWDDGHGAAPLPLPQPHVLPELGRSRPRAGV